MLYFIPRVPAGTHVIGKHKCTQLGEMNLFGPYTDEDTLNRAVLELQDLGIIKQDVTEIFILGSNMRAVSTEDIQKSVRKKHE